MSTFRQKGVYISVLNQGELRRELSKLLNDFQHSDRYRILIDYPIEKPITQNRNTIVQNFLARKDFDYLMMIDDDIVPPPEILDLVDFQKDIIVPLMFTFQGKKIIHLAMNRNKDGKQVMVDIEKKKGLIEIDSTGTGCIIISRKVLEAVKFPFKNEYDADGIKKTGLDFNFCTKAKKLGFKVWVHLNYIASHYATIDLKDIYISALEKQELLEELEELKIKDKLVGSGEDKFFVMDKHKFLMPDKDEKDIGIKAVMKDFSLYKKLWEEKTTELVKKELKEGQIAVDIGASIGYFTMLFARQVGETGKVYSFEPTPNQFPYLCRNIEVNGYKDIVVPVNKAAWNKKEETKMPPIDKKFDCQAITVDEVLEKAGIIDKIDFIKIDVDGSEPQVLKGLTKTFESNPNLKMVFEYYPKYIKDGGGSPEEVKAIIDKYFDYYVIEGDYGSRQTAGDFHCNWFCKKN